MASNSNSRVFVGVVTLVIISVITALLFLLFEGFSSTVLVLKSLPSGQEAPLAERLHTEYDSELGWVNKQKIFLPDMYGPGVYVRTNSEGFRNNKDFTRKVPDGKVRAICSGDSFTFGYGVDNDSTWCALLSRINSRVENVNMGQGGYGIDQAYLWFMRDGVKLERDIHIFAFINEDFFRMNNTVFNGYGKPVLKFENGKLTPDNVPVPKRGFYVPFMTQYGKTIARLRSVELYRELFGHKEKKKAEVKSTYSRGYPIEVLQALYARNRSDNSVFVAVYLPTSIDYVDKEPDAWRDFLAMKMQMSGIHFIDLVDDLRRLPENQAKRLFIMPGEIKYRMSAGHYTEEGNQYIAKLLYAELMKIEEASARLNGIKP